MSSPDAGLRTRQVSVCGSTALTRVPSPGVDVTVSLPPAASTWRALRWFLAGRWGTAERHPDRVAVRASRVRIATSQGATAPVQVDGEPFIKLADTPREGYSDVLDVVCRRNALRVLRPRAATPA